MGKVYFYTTAYNAEKTIRRCVDSVLQQNYDGEIVYYICENGSTDSTGTILAQYAKNDPRVVLFRNRKNRVWDPEMSPFIDLPHRLEEDDFFVQLDADDCYDKNFLSRMIPFMLKNKLDIGVCGISFMDRRTGHSLGDRTPPFEVIIKNPAEFSYYFRMYHVFMRPIWGKVFSGRVSRYMYTLHTIPEDAKVVYGTDTLVSFSALKHAKTIGLFPESLHYYYVSNKSVSHQYTSSRFRSDIYLYNDALNFLKGLSVTVSQENLEFLQIVYANALTDTIKVISNSRLSSQEKLHECLAIAQHPITQQIYLLTDSACQNARTNLLECGFSEISKSSFSEEARLFTKVLLPNLCEIVNEETLSVLLSNQLRTAFFQDDMDVFVDSSLKAFSAQTRQNQKILLNIFKQLVPSNQIFDCANHLDFIKSFHDIYFLLWKEEYHQALEEMTERLLSHQVLGNGKKNFLEIYIILSALEQNEPAYIFGKIQLATYFYDVKQWDAAKKAVEELDAFGAGEFDEVVSLKKLLSNHMGSTL